MRINWFLVVAATAQVVIGNGSLNAQGNVPVINSLNPQSRTAGSAGFSLIVAGANFRDGATVHWRGSARPTHLVNAGQLRAEIRATDIPQAGTAAVTVRQQVGQQDRESNAVNFTITPAGTTPPPATGNPLPGIASLSPSPMTAGAVNQSLYVDGSGFSSVTTVRWNGSDRPTDLVSPTRVVAIISGADLAVPGTAQITTFNPAPGGGTSAARPLDVLHPKPIITSLDPATRAQGGAQFTLTVNGTGFLRTGTNTVRWKGQPRNTEFVSAIRVRATIPASDLATVGDAAVTVETRAGTSTRTSDPARVAVLATSSVATITMATTPLSITRFHIGGTGNPERVLIGQAVALYAEHSGFPAPTHWKSSIDDGRAIRSATWYPISTPARHAFTTRGQHVRLFQYRRIAASDTAVSNIARDTIEARPPFIIGILAPVVRLGEMGPTYNRLSCPVGQIMTGARIRRNTTTGWIDGIGLVCAGADLPMIGATSGATRRVCSSGTVPGDWIGRLRTGQFTCEANVFGAVTAFDPLYAKPAQGVGPALWAGCSAGVNFKEDYKSAPIGLDVWREQRGVAGLGFICAQPD